HAKPVGVLDVEGYWDGLRRLLAHAVAERFVRPEYAALLLFADEPADLLDRFAAWPAPDVGRAWLDPNRTGRGRAATPWYTAPRSDCRVVLGSHRAVPQAQSGQPRRRAPHAPRGARGVRERVAGVHRDHRRPGAVGWHDPLQVARAALVERDGAAARRSRRM